MGGSAFLITFLGALRGEGGGGVHLGRRSMSGRINKAAASQTNFKMSGQVSWIARSLAPRCVLRPEWVKQFCFSSRVDYRFFLLFNLNSVRFFPSFDTRNRFLFGRECSQRATPIQGQFPSRGNVRPAIGVRGPPAWESLDVLHCAPPPLGVLGGGSRMVCLTWFPKHGLDE